MDRLILIDWSGLQVRRRCTGLEEELAKERLSHESTREALALEEKQSKRCTPSSRLLTMMPSYSHAHEDGDDGDDGDGDGDVRLSDEQCH